jgi:hypothetical protein
MAEAQDVGFDLQGRSTACLPPSLMIKSTGYLTGLQSISLFRHRPLGKMISLFQPQALLTQSFIYRAIRKHGIGVEFSFFLHLISPTVLPVSIAIPVNPLSIKFSMFIESLHWAYHIPFAFLVKRFHPRGYSPVRSVTMPQPQFYVEDRAPINCVESLHV